MFLWWWLLSYRVHPQMVIFTVLRCGVQILMLEILQYIVAGKIFTRLEIKETFPFVEGHYQFFQIAGTDLEVKAPLSFLQTDPARALLFPWIQESSLQILYLQNLSSFLQHVSQEDLIRNSGACYSLG